MNKMFKTITGTWNPYTGCNFGCRYCWAKRLVEQSLQRVSGKYANGFVPTLHPKELARHFKPGEFIFVSDMGDISFAKHDWLEPILERIRNCPNAKFLLQTKNPSIFESPIYNNLPNVYFGTTLETNRDYKTSKAPAPVE